MAPTWIKAALAVKSMIEFTLASQMAAAGQIIVGMCVAASLRTSGRSADA